MPENGGQAVRGRPTQSLQLQQRRTGTSGTVARDAEHKHRDAGEMPGAGTVLSVSRVLSSNLEARLVRERLARNMRYGAPLVLTLSKLVSGDARDHSPRSALQEICEFVAGIAEDVGFDTSRLGLCLRSHQLPSRAYLLISNSILGTGPRYLHLDSLQMRRHNDRKVQAETERNWRTLWQLRESGLQPVYGGITRSACVLLSDEVAPAVLPGIGILIPDSSAWLPLQLDLRNFLHIDGHLDWGRLSPALEATVRAGDERYNRQNWACRIQRTDAEMNRRLAIVLTGVGDLVQAGGHDPRSIETLGWLSGVIKRIRCDLHAASRALAHEYGPAESLMRSDPSLGLRAGPTRNSWRMHWEEAVNQSALRHRNMLVMSPTAVLPVQGETSTAYEDLLPVLRHADAWCFSATDRFSGWRLREFESFHRRAWAVIKGHSSGCVVAAGV